MKKLFKLLDSPAFIVAWVIIGILGLVAGLFFATSGTLNGGAAAAWLFTISFVWMALLTPVLDLIDKYNA